MHEEVTPGAGAQDASEEKPARSWDKIAREGVAGLGSAWMRLPGRSRVAAVIFVVCLCVYVSVMFLVPRYKGATTTQGDETHYLVITESILHDGDVFLANQYRDKVYRPYFEENDIMLHVTRGRGGRYVSTHPMFLSLVVLPGFWIFGYKGAALTMILITCFAAVFAFLVADRFVSRPIAAGTTLFLFFSYPLLFYSRLIYPETAAIFLVALGLWSGWRLRESGKALHAALLGASSGLLLLFHPKFIAISISFFILFLLVTHGKNRRLLAAWLVPAALAVVVLLALTAWAFGPSLVKGLTASGGSKFQGGYWGTNSGWGIPGMFLDRAWGLFLFAPLFLLFLPGLGLPSNAFEWEKWWVFFPICIGLHTLVLGFFQSWNGGAAPVQRYLVPLAALFLVCIAMFIDRVRSKTAYVVAAVLALLQIVVTVWTFRFFVGVYGMENTDNIFLPHFLDNGFIKKLLMFFFPLFHPAGGRAVLLTFGWIVLAAAAVYVARRYYMKHGGGRVSPLVDIRPFTRITPSDD
ncbi:MAG TPA: hypothetical protein VIK22_06695 [Candidatus Anoxymicrobiaceae bacterium]|jgi:hypothetical protein